MSAQFDIRCASCGRWPDETHGQFVPDSGCVSARDYVWSFEGTLDRSTGLYLCDDCYIKHGMPVGTGRARWTATIANLRKLGIEVEG